MFSAKDIFLARKSGYTIAKSLRFRSSASAYLSRTPGTAGNRKTFTISYWMKRGALGSASYLFSAGSGTTEATWFASAIDTATASDQIGSATWTTAGGYTNASLRDPSAWYHIVLAIDTTQATAANRSKLYINGVLQTYTGAVSLSLNADLAWNNSGVVHYIGARIDSGPRMFFDGYFADVYNIDGQALDPTYFGQTDTATGVWMPKKYTGTYGTNGFYLPFNLSTSSTYAGSFNGSTQLLSVADNAVFTMGSGDFTIEAWVNFAASGRQIVIYQGDSAGADASISFYIERSSSNYLRFYAVSGSTGYGVTGSTVIPNNQWVHIAGVRNGSNLVCYLNGVQQATTSIGSASINDSANTVQISGYGNGSASGLLVNGSISNVRIVKGTAVYTSNFTPPTTALTAISGTSLLCLQSSSATQDNSGNSLTITNVGTVTTSTATPFSANVASDASGNNNGWLPYNINASSPGVTYDSMYDTPTNYDNGVTGAGNYAVLNPLDKSSALTLAGGNLSLSTVTNSWNACGSTVGITSSTGKIYAECVYTTTSTVATFEFGLRVSTLSNIASVEPFGDTNGAGVLWSGTSSYKSRTNNVETNNTATTLSAGDIFQVAFDASSGSLWLGRNNSWLGGGNPSTATTPTYTGLTNSNGYQIVAAIIQGGSGTPAIDLNFGQRPFTYTPPTGFKALCTQNLPTPTIGATSSTLANKYFDATLYSSTNTSQNVVNAGNLQPGFLWLKDRPSAGNHYLIDVIRGSSQLLYSNATAAEGSAPSFVTSLNSNGFTVNGNGVYTSGNSIVAWQWAANGAGVSNTSGTITSTVSANVTAGFSVVTFTAPSSGAFTVGHGLNAVPKMIIVKDRTVASGWIVYHSSISTTTSLYLVLNTTAATATTAGVWGSALPTSQVFGLTAVTSVVAGASPVAYCFAEVAGYSKFGSYTGNGSTDGPFVYCGFRPKYVLIKRADSTGNWFVYDSARDPSNTVLRELYDDSSSAEVTRTGSSDSLDFVSNGFKIRFSSTYADRNASGGTYIYAAFAESPFSVNNRAR